VTIDLSRLPAPQVVEHPDFELLLAERKLALVNALPESVRAAIESVLALESEPLTKLLEENTLRELLLRQRVNEAAMAVLLPFSSGTDLDNLVANFQVERLLVSAGDPVAVPPVPPVYESDADLRIRAQAAFEGLSVGGPRAAYEFHARGADGRVADASAESPAPAEVVVTVLSREGDGAASAELLAVVEAALHDEAIRPVGDRLTVQSATIHPYTVEAELYLYPGPESEPILAEAQSRLAAFVGDQRRLGRDIRRSALYAALHVEGVQRVELIEPAADVVLDESQAAHCTGFSVTLGGTDE
jgi:phage-related baseplate assembly protein